MRPKQFGLVRCTESALDPGLADKLDALVALAQIDEGLAKANHTRGTYRRAFAEPFDDQLRIHRIRQSFFRARQQRVAPRPIRVRLQESVELFKARSRILRKT